jgi:hypothetical protein
LHGFKHRSVVCETKALDAQAAIVVHSTTLTRGCEVSSR